MSPDIYVLGQFLWRICKRGLDGFLGFRWNEECEEFQYLTFEMHQESFYRFKHKYEIVENANMEFLEITILYFVTAGTTEWRLLTYSGTLLLTNQFLT